MPDIGNLQDDEFEPGDGNDLPDSHPSEGSVVQTQSIMDRIKQRRESIGANTHRMMDIPGYEGELVGKFKRMRWEALAEIAERAEGSHTKRKALNGQADVVATACEELLIRRQLPGGDEELIPMHELFNADFGDTPVRFDPRLATWLDLSIDGTPTARKVVLGVFNNDLAVTAFHNELGAWMESSKGEEDEAFTTS